MFHTGILLLTLSRIWPSVKLKDKSCSTDTLTTLTTPLNVNAAMKNGKTRHDLKYEVQLINLIFK